MLENRVMKFLLRANIHPKRHFRDVRVGTRQSVQGSFFGFADEQPILEENKVVFRTLE
jgi:hypothetical protein